MTNTTLELDRPTASARDLIVELLHSLPDDSSMDRIIREVAIVACGQDSESDRSIALQAISRMPGTATFEDMEDELQLLIGLREADEDIEAGRLIPHAEVMKEVSTWST